MTRFNTILAATAATLLALPAAAQTEVVWWDFLGGGDGVRMKSLIDRFNSENADIRINGTTLEWGRALLHQGAHLCRRGRRAGRHDLSPVARAAGA